MEESEFETLPEECPIHTAPIPPTLHSLETGKPFETCLVSGTHLPSSDELYLIQKSYCKNEVVLEYAITLANAQQLNAGISHQSKDRIAEHIWEQVDFRKRFQRLSNHGPAFHHWIAECVFTGNPISESTSFTLVALCHQQNVLFLPNFPAALSDTCAEAIQRLLSAETRRYLDDFSNQFFPSPPKLNDLPTPAPLF